MAFLNKFLPSKQKLDTQKIYVNGSPKYDATTYKTKREQGCHL